MVENPTGSDRTKHTIDFIPIRWLDGNILSQSIFFFFGTFAKVLSTTKSGFNLCGGSVFLISVVWGQR